MGLAFAEALARGEWAAAHKMLVASLRDDCQPEDLKRHFREMTSYWDKAPESMKLGQTNSDRAYVAIYSVSETYGTVQEAVDVHVVREGDNWLVDEVIWGRP